MSKCLKLIWWGRSRHAFPVKGQTVHILGFTCYITFVTSLLHYCCSITVARQYIK